MINVHAKNLTAVKKILDQYLPGIEVWAFGSRVGGQAKSYSDLDLVIVGKSKIDRVAWVRLKEAFEESKLPFRVDLIDWNSISTDFQKIVTQNYEILQSGKKS